MEKEELIAILLGRRGFYSELDIINFVKNSKNYDADNLNNAEALKIFQSSKQKMWLVSTNIRTYCVLDDNRKDEPRVTWSIAKSGINNGDNISVEIKEPDYSEKSGLINIGTKKNLLYSKKLFKGSDVKKDIENLIKKTY